MSRSPTRPTARQWLDDAELRRLAGPEPTAGPRGEHTGRGEGSTARRETMVAVAIPVLVGLLILVLLIF